MRCPNCGEIFKIKKGKSLNFCGFCGTNLKTGEKSWTVNESSSPSLVLNNNVEKFNNDNLSITNSQPVVPKYDNVINSAENSTNLSAPEENSSTSDNKDISVVVPPSFDKSSSDSVFTPVDNNSQFSEISNEIEDLDITESIKELENTPFAPGKYNTSVNSSLKNIETSSINNDDDSDSTLTYMQYTKSSKEIAEDSEPKDEKENDFSSLILGMPKISPVEDKSLEFNKPLNSTDDLIEEITAPDVIAAKETSAPETPAEPEPEKELIIDYVGQDKSIATNTLKFKGMEVEVIYVTDKKEYDTIIAQSVEPNTEVVLGSKVTFTVSAGTWSEWSENSPYATNSNYITETMTQSRKRSRTRTIDKRQTTESSEFEDYTLVDKINKYSEWEVDQYHTSEVIPSGDTIEIMSKTTGFKYSGWFNPANMTGVSFSTPDVANFFNSNLSNVKWLYDEVIVPQNIKPDVKNWRLAHDSMTKSPAGDPISSNIFFSSHVINGKSYAMKFGSAETDWFIYRRRNLEETIYYFEKEIISDWNEWTEWDEQSYTPSEDCEVETRTLSRFRRKTTEEKKNTEK